MRVIRILIVQNSNNNKLICVCERNVQIHLLPKKLFLLFTIHIIYFVRFFIQ